MQSMVTSVESSEGAPMTLAMLRSSRFVAFAERIDPRPAAPAEVPPLDPTAARSAQWSTADSTAGPSAVDGTSLQAASFHEHDQTPVAAIDVGIVVSRGQMLEPPPTCMLDLTAAAHETAACGAGCEAASSSSHSCASSRTGSLAASNSPKPDLPSMIQCASPPPASMRFVADDSPRQNISSAGQPDVLMIPSDTVQMGSSRGAGTSMYNSRSTGSLRSCSPAFNPHSRSSVEADALTLTSCASVDTLHASEMPGTSRDGDIVAEWTVVVPAAVSDTAVTQSHHAAPDLAKHQWDIADHAATPVAASQPQSGSAEGLGAAAESLQHRLSDSNECAVGGSDSDASLSESSHELRQSISAGALPNQPA